MGKLVINSYDEFAAHLGEELGKSEWLQVDQDRINLFANATLDHQWIHVDVARAKEESPYKSTIAHGYLTLSLLPYMWDQIIEVNNIKMLVNYGMNDMRFGRLRVSASPLWRASQPSSTISNKFIHHPTPIGATLRLSRTDCCLYRASSPLLWRASFRQNYLKVGLKCR